MKTVDFDCDINGQTLETVTSNPYLGAERGINKQVRKVVAKGNKALGFIRRCYCCLSIYGVHLKKVVNPSLTYL
jgi:hypothetical protein